MYVCCGSYMVRSISEERKLSAPRWYHKIKPLELEKPKPMASRRSYVFFDTTSRTWMLSFRGVVPKNQYQSDRAARADLALLLSGEASIEWDCVQDWRMLYNRARDGKSAAANDKEW